MHIEVVTLFPELIVQATRIGVVGRALEQGRLRVGASSPRDFALDAHRTVDDRCYGGGPGMVLKVEPSRSALRSALARLPSGSQRIYLGAEGTRFTQAKAVELARLPGLVLFAGRYEGADERLLASEIDERLSIGDYVVSGGELPALVLIDAVARLLPGVLGDAESAEQDSFSAGLLDWPHYTRPEVVDGRAVPAVLRSGNHAAIERWRLGQALGRTWLTRPDLLRKLCLTELERQLLSEFIADRQRASCTAESH